MSKSPKPLLRSSPASIAARPVVFSLLLAVAGAAAAQAYDFTALSPASVDRNVGNAINNRGVVVGTSGPGSVHGFAATLWRTDIGTPLGLSPVAPYPGSVAHAINDAGLVGGADALSNAILWRDGQANVLPSLPGGRAAVFGLNEQGQAVGWSTRQDAAGQPTLGFATLWSGGTAQDLGGLGGNSSQALSINEHGWIAGWSNLADGFTSRATLWRDGQAFDLGTAGGSFSRAVAVNDHGVIAGTSMLLDDEGEDGVYRAVVWRDGALTVLDALDTGGGGSFARGLNNAGLVVGASSLAGDTWTHATLWQAAGPVDLNGFLSSADTAAGWHLVDANGINDSGWITGTAYNRLTFQFAAYRLSTPPIPEPESLVLMAAGLAVLWSARRKRRP